MYNLYHIIVYSATNVLNEAVSLNYPSHRRCYPLNVPLTQLSIRAKFSQSLALKFGSNLPVNCVHGQM